MAIWGTGKTSKMGVSCIILALSLGTECSVGEKMQKHLTPHLFSVNGCMLNGYTGEVLKAHLTTPHLLLIDR
jgi:hypothetical protein